MDARTDPKALFISAITVAELLRGAVRLPTVHPRRGTLLRWIDDVVAEFGDRVLPVDTAVARMWADLTAALPKGATVAGIDTLIAATAARHGHILVTRNIRDMSRFGRLTIENPWV